MAKTLVVIGGFARSAKAYLPLVEKAPANWRVLFLPISQIADPNDSIAINENSLKFLKENRLKKVSILGHSLGGAIALEFAYRYPKIVDQLFLLNSEGIYGNETVFQLFKNFLTAHMMHGHKKLKENIKSALTVLRKPVSHYKFAKHAHFSDLEQMAKNLKVPTTIIWGERDMLTPVDQAKKLHRLITGSNLIILKGLDHDWPLHYPEGFWENINQE